MHDFEAAIVGLARRGSGHAPEEEWRVVDRMAELDPLGSRGHAAPSSRDGDSLARDEADRPYGVERFLAEEQLEQGVHGVAERGVLVLRRKQAVRSLRVGAEARQGKDVRRFDPPIPCSRIGQEVRVR